MRMTAAAMLILAGLSGAAQAGSPEKSAVAIRYADIDLSTQAGQTMLERRVANALESVCGSYAGAIDTEERDIARCRSEAKAGVKPMVASLIARRGGAQLASR